MWSWFLTPAPANWLASTAKWKSSSRTASTPTTSPTPYPPNNAVLCLLLAGPKFVFQPLVCLRVPDPSIFFWGRSDERRPKPTFLNFEPLNFSSVQLHYRTQTRIHIPLAKRLLQFRKRRFSRAVPRRDPLYLPLGLQIRNQRVNLFHRRRHQVQPPKHNLRPRINRARCLQNHLNPRVRAPIHQQQSVRTLNCQRQFRQFQCSFFLRDRRHHKNPRRHFRQLAHQHEVPGIV